MTLRMMAMPLFVLGLVAASAANHVAPTEAGKTIVVKMVDKSLTEYAFEPADIVVNRGDVVRFVQTSSTPHNVEFKELAAGTSLNGDRVGPYLTQPDEVYEVAIDDRFAAGAHRFVCTPHEFMGMVGTLTVEASR